MSDLDRKLHNRLVDIIYMLCQRVVSTSAVYGRGDTAAATEALIEIKQAVREEGYMTGQEWYDRFVQELGAQQTTTATEAYALKTYTAFILPIAKKASGIQQ